MNTKTAQKSLKSKPIRLSRRTKKELSMNVFNERTAQRLEASIPKLAKNATALAGRQALTSGNRILIAEAGEVIEVRPNGTRHAVKKIEPSVKMQKGQVIRIK